MLYDYLERMSYYPEPGYQIFYQDQNWLFEKNDLLKVWQEIIGAQ